MGNSHWEYSSFFSLCIFGMEIDQTQMPELTEQPLLSNCCWLAKVDSVVCISGKMVEIMSKENSLKYDLRSLVKTYKVSGFASRIFSKLKMWNFNCIFCKTTTPQNSGPLICSTLCFWFIHKKMRGENKCRQPSSAPNILYRSYLIPNPIFGVKHL